MESQPVISDTSPAPAGQAPAATPENDSPRAKKGGGRLLGLFVVLLLVAAWLAPMIVANTSLKQRIPGILFPKFTGTITIGEASLGWLNTIELRNVVVANAQGDTVITLERMTTESTLLSLVKNASAPGVITFHKPQVDLQFDPTSSNVERVVNELLAGEATGGAYAYTFKVEQGEVKWREAAPPREFLIEGLDASFTVEGDASASRLALNLQSQIQGEGAKSPLKIEFDALAPQGATTYTQGRLEIQCDAIPLAMGEVFARRTAPDARLSGLLAAAVKSNWKLGEKADSAEWLGNGQVSVTDFSAAGFPQLGNDLPQFKAIVLAGQAGQTGPVITFQKLRLTTDVGGIDLDGPVPLSALLSAVSGEQSASQALAELADFRLSAAVDLARLAKLLPSTLRIREGVSIEAGRLEAMAVSSKPAANQQKWVVSGKLEGLEARDQDRKFSWPEPVTAKMELLSEGGVAEVENITIKSPFLVVGGRGTLDDGQVDLRADLARLAEECGRYIDLGGMSLQGELAGGFTLKRTTTERVTLAGQLVASRFACTLPDSLAGAGNFVWSEPELRLGIDSTLYAPPGQAPSQTLDGVVTLASASDKLTARLLQPVLMNGASGGVELTTTGGAGRWVTRARSLQLIGPYEADGLIDQQATITWSKDRFDVTGGKLRWSEAQLLGSGLQLADREIRVDVDASLDRATGRVTIPEVIVRSSALILDGKNLTVESDGASLQALAGDVGLKADLATLARWFNSSSQPMTTIPVGIVSGTVKIVAKGSAVELDAQLASDRIEIQSMTSRPGEPGTWQPLFEESNIVLNTLVKGELGKNDWELASFSLQGSGLGLTSRGRVKLDGSDPRVELTGELAYDWDRLAPKLASNAVTAGAVKPLRISGKGQRKFQFVGQLPGNEPNRGVVPVAATNVSGGAAGDLAWLQSMSGEAGVSWDYANYYNLEIGPAEIGGRLEEGWLRMTPINTTVNQGKVMIAPSIHLATAVPMLVLPKGPVAQNVQFSQELCETWLKYAAPLLADATRVSGSCSVDLAGGQIPLSNLNAADVGGVLKIHGAQVAAGPLATQITGVVQQVRSVIQRGSATGNVDTLMRMPEQQTDFRLVNGRLHHRQLVFETNLATIKTTGSVGLDESLQMVVQIPLLDDWIGDQKIFAGLKGQSINVPVGGTLSRPQIDGRGIGDLAKQAAGSAVESLIDGKLQNGLEKLLGRPR